MERAKKPWPVVIVRLVEEIAGIAKLYAHGGRIRVYEDAAGDYVIAVTVPKAATVAAVSHHFPAAKH